MFYSWHIVTNENLLKSVISLEDSIDIDNIKFVKTLCIKLAGNIFNSN